MISAEGVSKRFGPISAVSWVDLDIAPGQVGVLIGANGAGKSTLLRILATTVEPDGGRVMVAGIDARADPLGVRRRIGLVLGDERSWYWRLSGRANLEFFGSLHGMRRTTVRHRANELLDRFGLGSAADRRVDGWSSGMRARLSLARALLGDPAVLLLDEPTRSIDPMAAHEFAGLMRDLATEGTTVLMASHNLHEASVVGDDVIVMAEGRVSVRAGAHPSASDLEALLVRASQ